MTDIETYFNHRDYTPDQLRSIYDLLDRSITKQNRDINIERELLDHYTVCKEARDTIIRSIGGESSSTGVASALNAVTSSLKELGKLQTDLYNADKCKKLQTYFVNAIKERDDAKEIVAELERLMAHED